MRVDTLWCDLLLLDARRSRLMHLKYCMVPCSIYIQLGEWIQQPQPLMMTGADDHLQWNCVYLIARQEKGPVAARLVTPIKSQESCSQAHLDVTMTLLAFTNIFLQHLVFSTVIRVSVWAIGSDKASQNVTDLVRSQRISTERGVCVE